LQLKVEFQVELSVSHDEVDDFLKTQRGGAASADEKAVEPLP
jgi:hypothetical protein